MNTGRRSQNETPSLTQKERELLRLLEDNPGRCFSRAYLLKTIWGYSDNARTRTVDVHVSRLRKKLQGRRDILIHTVVRQGYVLQRNEGSRPKAQLNPVVPVKEASRARKAYAVGI